MGPSRILPLLMAAGSLASPTEIPSHALSLASGTFDTRALPETAAPGGRAVVKFPGPLGPEQHRQLAGLADRVYCYLPQHAYLVRLREGVGAMEARRAGASWSGAWDPAFKVGPGVAALRAGDGDTRLVMIRTFPDADLHDVAARVRALGIPGIVGVGQGTQFGRIRLLMPAGEVVRHRGALAAMADVFWLDVEPRLTLSNDTTIWVGQSGTSGGQQTPVFARGLYGEGQVVGIIDTGIDPDMCYFADGTLGLPPVNPCNGGTAVDVQQRKVLAVDFLWSNDCAGGIGNGDWDDQDHGTHVAGTVAGDRGTPLGHDGGDGMAPGAKLVIQDGGYSPDNCGDLPGIGCPVVSLYPLFQQAYDQGARIHTNSYGDNENASVQNDYTAASEDVDQFMWDHKDFLVFFAAGNAGPWDDTVGSPSTAKSCVSVGATSRGSSAESMAFFSSCGYTDDNRYKPEITIPGENIVSADNDGSAGSGNCSTQSLSGTSMASPAAAGLTALAREYFTDGYYPTGAAAAADARTPSAALLRATIVNSGHDMTGFLANDIPSRCQGWGRILLDDALFFSGDARKLWLVEDAGFPTGSTAAKDFPVDVLSASQGFKATVAWTDYPSTPAAMPHLVNDLDLVVTAPDGTTVYRGNVFTGGQSQTGGSADRRNTLEQVLVRTPQVGTYTVRVQAFTVPSGPQPFALLVTGDVQGAAPAPTENAVVGQGLGQPNVNRVRAYTGAGIATAVDFLAYGAGQWGVSVASGNVDGAADGEILTGPGPGDVFGPQVRAFDRAGTAVAKVSFYAYGTLRYGVNPAAAGLDGDAAAEILSGPGPGAVFGPHVRGFNYDGVAVSPMAKLSFYAYGTLRYGVNVEGGLLDGDAVEEIVTGPGPGAIFGPQVRGFDYTGSGVAAIAKVNFNAFTAAGYGVTVAAATVDADAYSELASALGPGPGHAAQLRGHGYDGTAVALLPGFDVTPFPTQYGARVGLGDMDGDAVGELLAAAGRDATADSTVKPHAYDGASLAALAGSFLPFGAARYGVNVAGADLGY